MFAFRILITHVTTCKKSVVYKIRRQCVPVAPAENVVEFLTGIAERLRPVAEREMQTLQSLKEKNERSNEPIYAWDRPYYSGMDDGPRGDSSHLSKKSPRLAKTTNDWSTVSTISIL